MDWQPYHTHLAMTAFMEIRLPLHSCVELSMKVKKLGRSTPSAANGDHAREDRGR